MYERHVTETFSAIEESRRRVGEGFWEKMTYPTEINMCDDEAGAQSEPIAKDGHWILQPGRSFVQPLPGSDTITLLVNDYH